MKKAIKNLTTDTNRHGVHATSTNRYDLVRLDLFIFPLFAQDAFGNFNDVSLRGWLNDFNQKIKIKLDFFY